MGKDFLTETQENGIGGCVFGVLTARSVPDCPRFNLSGVGDRFGANPPQLNLSGINHSGVGLRAMTLAK